MSDLSGYDLVFGSSGRGSIQGLNQQEDNVRKMGKV
jgi:hypothetical protein